MGFYLVSTEVSDVGRSRGKFAAFAILHQKRNRILLSLGQLAQSRVKRHSQPIIKVSAQDASTIFGHLDIGRSVVE